MSPPFTPETPFEVSLLKASTDTAHQLQFYRDFLAAQLLFIQEGPPPTTAASRILNPGEKISIAAIPYNNIRHLPVFSSMTRLSTYIQSPAHYISINARAFIELTRCDPLALNPGSKVGKLFTTPELRALLDGSMFNPTQRTIPAGTKVLLAQPARYPTQLTDALSALFKTLPDVDAAYLAHFHNPSQNEKPHTLIALKVSKNYDTIGPKAGHIVSLTPIPDPPVDFLNLSAAAPTFTHYFNSIPPFYKRKKFLSLF